MKPTRLELLVGLFVLLGIAAVLYLTVKLGAGSLPSGDTYLLQARFTNASGLHRGGSVVVSGVTVGRVEEIRLNGEDFCAIATLRIQSTLRLPTDSMASIKTSGLIGDKFVALMPGADEAYLEPGNLITMTESSVDLESLISKMAFGSAEETVEPQATPQAP